MSQFESVVDGFLHEVYNANECHFNSNKDIVIDGREIAIEKDVAKKLMEILLEQYENEEAKNEWNPLLAEKYKNLLFSYYLT